MLLLICQRYNFESNSQPVIDFHHRHKGCYWYVKDTILKAIHNANCQSLPQAELLLICQRYNFESNSQRDTDRHWPHYGCYWYVKDTILKAIHNEFGGMVLRLWVVTDMSKIQFWKQFTTTLTRGLSRRTLLLICQRYNFESNSQQNGREQRPPFVVTDMSKIQFWKQFTTRFRMFYFFGGLLLICQRYNFESNSQL